MDTTSFEAKLRDEGFTEIEFKTYAPKPENGEHGHHFDVRGLVLEGAFLVRERGVQNCYGPGQIFTVPNDTLHTEEIGAAGARVLIGRRYRSA